MKAAALSEIEPKKKRNSVVGGVRMTRVLAERRAVGDAKKPKFDGVDLLRLLKK